MTDEVRHGNAAFLQPGKVGSSIRYEVEVGGTGPKAWTEGAVHLTDCDRRICWRGDIEDVIIKIDNAVKMLQEARGYMVKAKLELAKRQKSKVKKR
jgi:hypothetical protein